MMIMLLIGLGLSLCLNLAMVLLLLRASRQLLAFDDMVNYLADDLETNVQYFEKLTTTPVLSNAPEIVDANRNMSIMAKRLDEFLNRFEELTGKKIRVKTSPKQAPQA